MLKRVIVLFIGITSLSVSSFAQEQTNIISTKTVKTLSKTPDYAMGVSTEKHLKAAIQLFHQFETSGVTINNFEIVVWGKVVSELKNGGELAELISKQVKGKLKITVCNVALNFFDMTGSDIPDNVKIIPNAYIRMYELNALGYNTFIP